MREFVDSLINALGRMLTAVVVAGPWWLKIVVIAPIVTITIVYALRRLRRPSHLRGRHES